VAVQRTYNKSSSGAVENNPVYPYTVEDIEELPVAELKTERENPGTFVAIADTGNNDSYGGDQTWYQTILNKPDMNKTGCGSIAAANIIYYYAQTCDSGRNLVSAQFPTQIEYTDFAANIYCRYIKQTVKFPNHPLGVWSVKAVSSGLKKYFRQRKTFIKKHLLKNGIYSFKDAAEFIKEGLDKNCPVVLHVLFSKYAKSFYDKGIMTHLHFVTITRLVEKVKITKEITDIDEEKTLKREVVDYSLTISTWGRRTEIPSLKELWKVNTPLSAFKKFLHSIASLFRFKNIYLAYYELL